MAKAISGIYQIVCIVTGSIYIGSSKTIVSRWMIHRRELNRGKSTCTHLQHAWTKYGEKSFQFSIVEECNPDDLESIEQLYIDLWSPKLNCVTDVKRRYGKEQREKIAAAARARAAERTHCPKGHLYAGENLYIGKKGEPRCKQCNSDRVAKIIADESDEQYAARLKRNRANYYKDIEKSRAAILKYAEMHREEKRAYDKARKAERNEYMRKRRNTETPEQREIRLKNKRENYHRNKKSREQSAVVVEIRSEA